MFNSLISINDLSAEEVRQLLSLAADLKKRPQDFRNVLEGRMFGFIFEKPSTRTWVSFQSGIFSMGGGVIYLGPEDIKLGVREEVRDVARVLNRYLAGVVMRTFSHWTITEFRDYFEKPVINGLSDKEHPCQALADYMTIYEKIPAEKDPVLAFVGDGNNVLNSLMLVAAKLGAKIRYATPKKYQPDPKIVKAAQEIAQKTGAVIEGFFDPAEAVKDADAIYTDVWVSMGEEAMRKKKLKDFQGMQVNKELVAKAKKGALIMHCLPAHRGEEITDSVMESKNCIVFDEAENRLHIQKAVLLYLHQQGAIQ
ncbi:MAG TPA: ornithine carbamoyltransferase [Candidatus Omnitrophota bacterium]|nr:ornithine carbamoyltransferase [Candidatus Omnitrophota bacterium]HPS37249.1 ornithine carbamoyltransferase [Candidatus Omnitrophota bacterium]